MLLELVTNYFSSLKKAELLEIADFFGFPVERRAHKAVLLDEVCHFLTADPQSWLSLLPQRDAYFLKKLIEEGPGKPVYLEYPDNISVIELLKIVGSEYDNEDYRKVWIDSPVFELTAPYIKSVIEEKEQDGSYQIERVVMGYLYIYGIISAEDLVDIMFKELEMDTDFDRINDLISHCPAIHIYKETISGRNYFFSPNLFDIEEVLGRISGLQEVREYKYFNWEEAGKAGKDAPYNCYGLDTPEGEALVNMLVDLDYNSEERASIIHRIWYCAQFAGDDEASEQLFDCIGEKQDWFDAFEEYKSCVDIITAYANSLPKWVLKGHSANELNLMKISIKVDLDDEGQDDLYEGPCYECAAVCNSSGKDGWAWMIFSKSDSVESKFKRTVAS